MVDLEGPPSGDIQKSLYEELVFQKQISKIVYGKLIADEEFVNRYRERWNLVDSIDFESTRYKKAFSNSRICTQITKLRDFQYRLLLKKIITNSDLYDWKLTDCPLCMFCKNTEEDIVHCLITCERVKPLWIKLFKFLENLDIETNQSIESILLNDVHENSAHIVNFCTLLLKQYIYKKRCQKKVPSYEQFIVELEISHNVDFANAKVAHKLYKYKKRWNPIVDIE